MSRVDRLIELLHKFLDLFERAWRIFFPKYSPYVRISGLLIVGGFAILAPSYIVELVRMAANAVDPTIVATLDTRYGWFTPVEWFAVVAIVAGALIFLVFWTLSDRSLVNPNFVSLNTEGHTLRSLVSLIQRISGPSIRIDNLTEEEQTARLKAMPIEGDGYKDLLQKLGAAMPDPGISDYSVASIQGELHIGRNLHAQSTPAAPTGR